MRRLWLLLLLFLSVAASAQTPQVGAMLGLNQTFSGANSFTLGVELGPYTVSQLSTLTGLTNITIVSDGTPGSSPCTGGSTGAVATYYNSQWNCGGSSGGGGDTITSPNSTLTVGGSSTATTLDINLAQTNTWTGAQTFGTITPATISGAPNFSAGFRIEGSTIITSASSANSQAVTCATGGTGTQVCDASGAWIAAGIGTVTSFAAPSGSWPTWLVPTVTNSTSTPSLAVAASAIPNSALANAATTVNGQTCTLGSTCTISTGSGTVTSFSAGNLSPLFTTSVATATTTPALTFSLTNAAAGTVFGNATGSAAGPSFSTSEVLGTTGQSSTSTLTMYGSTASSNLAPPYLAMCAETGSTCAWLYPSTSFNGGFGINSSAPTTDIATPHVLYAPGGLGPVYVTGSSSTTGLLQCPVAGTSDSVADCATNATIFYGVAEGTGNSNTRLKSYGVVTVNIPSSTTSNGDYICSGTLSAATYNAVDNGSTKCAGGQQVGFAITKNASPVTSVQVQLTSANGVPSGVVTSITAGTGLTGGTITGSGTIALSTPVTAANGGTGVSNTATLTLGTSNRNYASLGTGIEKNTTTTGAVTNAAASDIYSLFTSCTGSSGLFLKDGGTCAAAGAGVTSISGDGTVITNSASTGAVTLTIAGTSGGVPYFSSTSGWASSAVLPSGDFVLGGGAGSAPTATFSVVPLTKMTQVPFDSQANDLTTPTGNGSFTYPTSTSANFSLTGTAPSSSSSAGTAEGNIATLAAGAGGATTGSATTAGAGGGFSVTGGAGGSGSGGTNASGGAGGSINLIPGLGGAKSGSGTAGANGQVTCGLAGTIGCVIGLAGLTSGIATITAPAVAGTSTNPFVFSNDITLHSGNSSINGPANLLLTAGSGDSIFLEVNGGVVGNFSASGAYVGSVAAEGAGTLNTAGGYYANGTLFATSNGTLQQALGLKYTCTHGSNATCGVSTLSSGTVTVSTTAIAALATAGAGDAISLTLETCSSCGTLSVGTVTAATSFVINSTNGSDASSVYWEIRHIN